tara:strand:- start:191 stop:571 length:381 start_codon:yes stop_codon:yes gene_type:complete
MLIEHNLDLLLIANECYDFPNRSINAYLTDSNLYKLFKFNGTIYYYDEYDENYDHERKLIPFKKFTYNFWNIIKSKIICLESFEQTSIFDESVLTEGKLDFNKIYCVNGLNPKHIWGDVNNIPRFE